MRQIVIWQTLASRGLSWMDHNSNVMLQTSPAICGTPIFVNARILWAVFMVPFLALLLLAMPAISQTMPENASAKSYGEGWECNFGYRLIGDNCAAVVVPENAYETNRAYGLGWECRHGYREVDETACVAVVVPEGGFLDPSGERWHCLRGFFKVDDTCQVVVVPENGYLSVAKGGGWRAVPGFIIPNR